MASAALALERTKGNVRILEGATVGGPSGCRGLAWAPMGTWPKRLGMERADRLGWDLCGAQKPEPDSRRPGAKAGPREAGGAAKGWAGVENRDAAGSAAGTDGAKGLSDGCGNGAGVPTGGKLN